MLVFQLKSQTSLRKVYSDVWLKLNIKRSLLFNHFGMLVEKVGLRDETEFIEPKFPSHTNEILKTWSKEREQVET